ncbi:hypothetical protein BJ165DRAFT_1534465 [Panaeolus papilionaceus]|nr:hypothetical protein BJ165DRAFT_1534465 [Panaeolus papilionaceus]
MPTAPNPALFGHRPVLQPTNTNTTPVNTSPAILPSKAGPRHIAQPTSSANSLTIHALAARPTARPTALPVPLTTQSALPAIAQPTPAAVPASLTFHPVVQPTVAYTPHPGPLAAVSAFVATPPWGHSPFVDTPHPNPTLTTAPDPYATHSPGQSPLPAPNIPIDPRLLSQETQDDEDLIPSAMIQEEASIEDVDAEVIRLRKVIADQNERYALAIAAGKISPGIGFHDAPNDSIPKPPQLYKKSLLTAMGFTEADKGIYNCMRSVVRGCMSYCASNYQKKWSLQDPSYVEKVVNIARTRCPELARYQGGWAVKSMMCSSGKYKRRADVLKKSDPLGSKRAALASKAFSTKMANFLKEQGLMLVAGQTSALPGAASPALPGAASPGEPHYQAEGNDGNDAGIPLAADDPDDHSQALDAAEPLATGHQDEGGYTSDNYASFDLHFPTPDNINPLPDIQPDTLLIPSTHPLLPVESAFAVNETPVSMPNIEPALDNPSQVEAIGLPATATISNVQPLASMEESNLNGARVLRRRPASNTPAPAAKRAKITSGVGSTKAKAALIQDSEDGREGEGEGDVSGKGKGKGKGRGRGRGGGGGGGERRR